ncbi:MAG: hypothetical protein Q7S14_02725 [bacterium]|nr:hypothetical protein [bacterium]
MMLTILKLLKILLVFAIISSIAILGYFVYKQEQSISMLNLQGSTLQMADVEALVDEKIAAIKFPVASPSAPVVVTKIINNKVITPQPKEFIITLGSGTITETEKWLDIPSAQASINLDNYPGIKTAYFEVAMHIPNAQGEMRAKLVETTLPFYYGEILKTQSGTDVTLSTPMFLKPGNRNYRVQLYNQIGTGILDSARIRIVTE